MAESASVLLSKSRDLLATSNPERLELLLNQFASPDETIEFKSSLSQFKFCAAKYPNCLTLMLLKVYLHSSNEITKLKSITLLSSTLDEFRTRKTHLNRAGLKEIKPILITCLQRTQERSEVKILTKIVSFVACDVSNDGWDELSECMLTFTETRLYKALHVFPELPRLYASFFNRFVVRLVEEASKVLVGVMSVSVENLSLVLVTLVKMGVQVHVYDEMDQGLVERIYLILMKSVRVFVKWRMHEYLIQGLEGLEVFLVKDVVLYGYNEEQCAFVQTFLQEVGQKVGGAVEEVAKRIFDQVNCYLGYDQHEDERDDFEQFNKLPFGIIVRMFLSDDYGERLQDMAIRRLNLLLSDENPKKADIDVKEMRKLQPWLVYSLSKKKMSESVFKVLGEVVYRVALEMMFVQEEIWFGLRDYIRKGEFKRAVYIFRCLAMPLDIEEFVVPVMEKLFPEISARLNPPYDVLVDNSGWVLAFTGAFCAMIHLVKVKSYAHRIKVIFNGVKVKSHGESVREIAYKMIESVRKLVERGMEVGLVMRAFRDVESILKEHLDSFTTTEYKFVKGMLLKLYEIKGMTMESKVVLWRINVLLERGVAEEYKELPKSEFDWINQHED